MAHHARLVDAAAISAACVFGVTLLAQGLGPPPPQPGRDAFVVPVAGTLYLKCLGGSAGGLSQFGLGSSPTTFVSYLSALPKSCPTAEVAAGNVVAQQTLAFGIQTWWADQSYWAFSMGTDFGSHVAFSDVNNRLGWGGSIIQATGTNTWVLHLNDAAHYTLTADAADNVLIQIRVQPAGEPNPPAFRSGSPGALVAAPSAPPARPVSPVAPVRDALRRATNALQHSANQSCPVVKAMTEITKASSDLTGAMAFLNSQHDTSVPPLAPKARPEFTPPPRPAPQRNVMLEDALTNLKTAFDTLATVPGGDLGGARAKVDADIASAASDLLTAMNAANAAFLDGRRDLPPCASGR